nr:MAG TPA: hypothetical protein [Caudoviricetes sp.]
MMSTHHTSKSHLKYLLLLFSCHCNINIVNPCNVYHAE